MLKLITFLKNYNINTSTIDIYDIRTGELLVSCRLACNPDIFNKDYDIQRIENNSNGTLSIYVA